MKQDQMSTGVRATVVKDLRAAFRGLRLGKEQRILVVQAVVIGIVVWIAIFALKESVHWLFHQVLHWIEHAPTPWVLFIPLVHRRPDRGPDCQVPLGGDQLSG